MWFHENLNFNGSFVRSDNFKSVLLFLKIQFHFKNKLNSMSIWQNEIQAMFQDLKVQYIFFTNLSMQKFLLDSMFVRICTIQNQISKYSSIL